MYGVIAVLKTFLSSTLFLIYRLLYLVIYVIKTINKGPA